AARTSPPRCTGRGPARAGGALVRLRPPVGHRARGPARAGGALSVAIGKCSTAVNTRGKNGERGHGQDEVRVAGCGAVRTGAPGPRSRGHSTVLVAVEFHHPVHRPSILFTRPLG